MKKISILFFVVLSVIAFSCKKNKDKSAADMLQGKWYGTVSYSNEYYNSQNHPDTTVINKGDVTFEFKGDQAYFYVAGSSVDTGTFKVIDGPKLVINNEDTVEIKKITDNQLTTYIKYSNSYPPGYSEETVDYNKY